MISMVSRAATRALVLARRSAASMAMLFVAVFVMAGLALPGAALAQGMIGSSVTAQYHNPTLGNVLVASGPHTVSSGVEVASLSGVVSVDVTATQVILTQLSGGTWTNNTHNGPVVVFTGFATPITAVALDASSTATLTSLSFTADSVIVSWAGQQSVAGNRIVINVTGPTVASADTTPPVVVAPANIVVQANPGEETATVTYSTPTATDNVDGSRPVTQTAGLPSGSSFPIGVTTNCFRATDVAGNNGNACFTVTVNPGAPQVLGGSGNGPESGGQTATYIGTGFTGATAVHFGANAAPSFTVISDTQISVVTPAGTGTVDVTVTTPWGTSSTVGGFNDYQYVPRPPAPSITAPANGDTTGRTPTISGTSEAGRTLDVYIDGDRVGFPTADGSGNWSYTSASLAEGSHTVRATARGIFEDSPSTSTVTFTVDGTPPAAPVITSPVSGNTVQTVTDVFGTSEPFANITVTIEVEGATAPSGSLAAGGNFFGSTRADASGNWRVSRRDGALAAPGSQSVGEVSTTLTALAQDAAGNVSPVSAPVILTTDSVPPVTPVVTSPTPGQTFQGGNPTFTGTAEPGAIVDVYVDGLYNGTTTANGMGGWSHTFSDNPPTAQAAPSGDGRQSGLSAGSHSIYTESRDLAGNSSTSATVTFNIVLLSINETSLSNGAVASAFSRTLTTTGCTGPCTFAVTSGALPAGVTLSSAGVFSGTPTAGGVFNFTVTVTDAGAGGITASQAYTLTINAPTVSSASTLVAG
ncbi:MAG: HYR domain-containing protein, partial [Brevundimonas sp.]